MKVYGVVVGKKPLIFTNNDSAYETAIEFKKNGIDPIILDTREEQDTDLINDAKNQGIKLNFPMRLLLLMVIKKLNLQK